MAINFLQKRKAASQAERAKDRTKEGLTNWIAIEDEDDGTSQLAPSTSEANQRAGRPHSGKKVVSLRIDPDIIEAFRATGKGWQARMNDALRKAMP